MKRRRMLKTMLMVTVTVTVNVHVVVVKVKKNEERKAVPWAEGELHAPVTAFEAY